ncbi:MAG TPA: tetratricopeptide repeat protein [Pyrinomonadaceae bacterium]|nr:tetratricopeptide repeat protein [Pyrinomonadaceae bacterium]
MKRWLLLVVALLAGAVTVQAQTIGALDDSLEVVAARKSRDRAEVAQLQKLVENVRREAEETKRFEAYLRLALFNVWLCEAAEAHQNKEVFKQAAESGVAAAEKAVELNPQSSEAHQLLGDLLNQLIPHVFGGGMRYGKRSTDELDKAIELNPKNADAYVSRAISYYYTPESFGGSKEKAFELLKKAVEIAPHTDSPHIWLAMFNLEAGRTQEALREINLARRANPERSFTNFVYSHITSSMKKAKRGRKPASRKTAARKAA